MILPDVNVLIYAFRADSPHHRAAHSFLTSAAGAEAPFGMSTLALSALVRITTNPRLAPEPSAPEECFAFCQALLDQPNCRLVEPGARHWSIFVRLCRETGARGPIVADAWFAALAIEHGCEWITFDRDFARFEGLRYRAPAQGGF